jgi:hypothetical protein
VEMPSLREELLSKGPEGDRLPGVSARYRGVEKTASLRPHPVPQTRLR